MGNSQQGEVHRRGFVEAFLEDVDQRTHGLTLLQELQHLAFKGPLVFTLTDIGVEPIYQLVKMDFVTDRDAEGMKSILRLQVHRSLGGGFLLGHITLSLSLLSIYFTANRLCGQQV